MQLDYAKKFIWKGGLSPSGVFMCHLQLELREKAYVTLYVIGYS